MGIFSDIVGDVKASYYSDHAFSLGASPNFFRYRHPDDCIQMDDMIVNSTSKGSLDRKVNDVLRSREYSDFYDYSLVMGKFTGVYNIYGYQPLSSEIKRSIAGMTIDPKKTRAFLDRQFDSLAKYFQTFHHIHADRVQQDIARMYEVGIDDSIYRSPVCRDVGKILIVTSLSFRSLDSNYINDYLSPFIENGDIVRRFDEVCHIKPDVKVNRR